MDEILVTGFEAFGNTPVNPAEQVVKLVNGESVEGVKIVAKVIPNVFFRSIDVVTHEIARTKPELVVMMGEYGGRSMITIERLAHNLIDSARYGLADNDGKVLHGELTVEDGPNAYYSTLPIKAMVQNMRDQGIPADISDTPGTNVCNHLMYGVLHFVATKDLPIRTGWTHLPHLPSTAALPENIGTPSMSATTSAKGVIAGIRAALQHSKDIDQPILSRWQI